MPETLKSPYPFFGSKARVANLIWDRIGNVPNYVEGFFGSGAILLRRPHPPGTETVGDADGMVSNFWRAVQQDADGVAKHADWPVIEQDLSARHLWLVRQRESLTERLQADPEFYDVKVAGWWVWGASIWIGGGWCTGKGPWVESDGLLVHRKTLEADQPGVKREIPDLGSSGKGVHQQVPCLGHGEKGTQRKAPTGISQRLPHLRGDQGVNRKLPDVASSGKGVHRRGAAGSGMPLPEDEAATPVRGYLRKLQQRLRRVRVACGDWSRIMGPAVTTGNGMTGVILDPPYADAEHSIEYAGGGNVFADVVAWCRENGGNPLLRIVLCGYDSGNVDLPGWEVVRWKTNGGYGNQGQGRGRENAGRETLWFSPACSSQQGRLSLFESEPDSELELELA